MKKDYRTATIDRGEINDRLGFITEDELLGILGISAGTARNRQAARTMPPHYKLGRKKVYDPEEVRAWVKRRRVG